MAIQIPAKTCEVILGNANKRFSGVTSTMLQTYEYQHAKMHICILGKHHVKSLSAAVGFIELASMLWKQRQQNEYCVFHARRNNEMVQALILKHVFRAKLRILFTSTAQRYHSRFSRWLMSHMDMIISTCQAAANYLVQPPSTLVPHGIRTDIYTLGSNKPHNEGLTIGIFGRVRPQKGTHLFVNACIDSFPSHPNAKARIVGAITKENDTFVQNLKKKISDAGLQDRIEFTGELDFSELPTLFQNTDVVMALSNTEGFGLTVLEAMACGAAVIATEAGAWPEIVEQGKHGYIVPVNDQKAINERLQHLLQNRDTVFEMGRKGHERIQEHYQIQSEANRLCELYRLLQHPNYKKHAIQAP